MRKLAVLVFVALAGCSAASGYPAYDGEDLDCSDIGHPVRVDGADPHGLDRDGDGVGCEAS